MGACVSTKNMHEIQCDASDITPIYRKRDLINGYCQQIEFEQIIPIEIIQLCLTFYGYRSTKKVFFGLPGNISSSIEIVKFDINCQQISYLKHNKFPNDIISTIGPFCFIPDINPNKGLDGILCVNQTSINNVCNPTLLLFDSNHINTKLMNNTVKYCKIEFLSTTIKPTQFIFCGRNNGIICMKYGCLYRVQLPIDLDFMDINHSMYKFKFFDTNHCWKRNDRVNMCYLPDKQQIFALQSNGTKYGIFEFKNNQWKYKKSAINILREFKLCYDGKRMVYAVTDDGKVIGYDLNINQWIKIMRDSCFKPMKQFVIWIEKYDYDRNNIYCADGIYLRYFNTKSKKWKQIKQYTEIWEKLGKKSVIFE